MITETYTSYWHGYFLDDDAPNDGFLHFIGGDSDIGENYLADCRIINLIGLS